MGNIIRMKKTKPARRAKVIDITERRRAASDRVKFIDDAHGGLAPFRGCARLFAADRTRIAARSHFRRRLSDGDR